MSEPTQEEIISIISSVFSVTGISVTLEKMEFEISDIDIKEKFVGLARKLEQIGIVCFVQKYDNRTVIQINRLAPEFKKKRFLSGAWLQRILFAVVIAFTLIDGYYKTLGVNRLAYIGEPIDFAILYTISLIGILGIHEAGHLIAAKWHKVRTTWPYFIPGIPVFGLVPTFGAIIQSRGLMVNRDIIFDIGISGPIAGLIIAVLVSFYGAYTSPILDPSISSGVDRLQNLDDSIFMQIALGFFGKTGSNVQVLMSPVMFAAWIGFLITFLNLLPAWQLDGGHMAHAVFGRKIHRIATYASVGVLFLLRYEMMAFFILIFSMRNMSVRPLDDVSPLSKNRKLLYIVVVILAVLCAPMPFSIWR